MPCSRYYDYLSQKNPSNGGTTFYSNCICGHLLLLIYTYVKINPTLFVFTPIKSTFLFNEKKLMDNEIIYHQIPPSFVPPPLF